MCLKIHIYIIEERVDNILDLNWFMLTFSNLYLPLSEALHMHRG